MKNQFNRKGVARQGTRKLLMFTSLKTQTIDQFKAQVGKVGDP